MSDPHDPRAVSRRQFLETTAAVTGSSLIAASAAASCAADAPAAFASDFASAPDRVWIGPEYWANPMEDWCVKSGRIEPINSKANHSVHLLTCELTPAAEPFEMAVRLGMIEKGKNGSAGFRFGVHDAINDYRRNCFMGGGWNAVVTGDGHLFAIGKRVKLDAAADLADLALKLTFKPDGDSCAVTLAAFTPDGKPVGSVDSTLNQPAAQIYGNIALVNNHENRQGGVRAWFTDWKVSGPKVAHHADRAWGPILWAMHTLSDNRNDDRFVMKMIAFVPPMGETDPKNVDLHVQRDGKWTKIATEPVEPDSCSALFRVTKWGESVDTPYKLTFGDAAFTGTIRKNPVDKPLAVGNLTCQSDHAFPHKPVADNLTVSNPDMLFFSGDQLYESSGGFGIIRDPADRAILNYLRKFYMFGWAFGDLLRDRPTVCLPDDHDVFHPNIWGEDGKAAKHNMAGADGGYMQPARMVNVVHRTNCHHHPDFFDPTPILQDISVYYGDMVYGRVSFAILSDRQFKSAPMKVDTGSGRPDWVPDKGFDVSTLDKPGLELLGDRQHKFLDHWAADWRGADMKVVLSETVFANAATHHGNFDNYLVADLDSNGWPQTARNEAVRSIRRAFPVHLNGDQHLTTLLQHGVDAPRDSFWSFSAPAISCLYQRWWRTDELKRPVTDRPAHNIPNTGQYRDGFGNMVYMYALGNPAGSGNGTPDRYAWADERACGFGILRVDRDKRTYTFESYRHSADLAKRTDDHQYPGFPHTVAQRDNFPAEPTGTLAKLTYDKIKHPVLKVTDEKTGQLVYALRLTETTVEPWVFTPGPFTVELGDPDTNDWLKKSGIHPA